MAVEEVGVMLRCWQMWLCLAVVVVVAAGVVEICYQLSLQRARVAAAVEVAMP